MPRVPSYIDTPEKDREALLTELQDEVGKDGAFKRFRATLDRVYYQLARVLNGRVSFGNGVDRDNIDGVWITVTTPAVGDTDFTVTHNLGRLPVGYWLMQSDLPSLIYDGSVAATITQLTLRNATDSATIVLFIV